MISRRTVLAGLAGFAGATLARAAENRPSVLLIVAGSWRAQAVPWAGDRDLQATNLQKFAEGATTFGRAYSCYGRLDRARPCLLKGIFPHALQDQSAGQDAALELGALLGKAGYVTAAFNARQAGDIVNLVHAPGVGERPFFIEWTLENAGAGLMERTNADTLRLRENVPASAEPRAREELSVFYARARTLDREMGVVLEALDRPGTLENTIVVFTSYHGEQFGSHGETGDDSMYEESIRIPLAIRFPRALRGGATTDLLVSQVDLAPTLLGLCGVPIPEAMQGRDLSAVLLGQSAERPDSIYAEGRVGQKDEWRMVVAGYDKLVTDLEGHATHLFNLAEDPYEETDLAAVSSRQLKRDELLALQRVWMKKLGDGVDASGLKKR